jgi:hypothetical protein
MTCGIGWTPRWPSLAAQQPSWDAESAKVMRNVLVPVTVPAEIERLRGCWRCRPR